jgi:YD repeat-containing protein
MTEVSTSTESSDQNPVTNAAAVDWDHTGRVISSRFTNGAQSHFRYDASGNLYAFSYARLAWSTMDGVNWTARDQHHDWTMAGRVDVSIDGAIRVELGTVTRTLKLDGSIVDEFADGSVSEVVRSSDEQTPADLMAAFAARASVREPQALMPGPASSPGAAASSASDRFPASGGMAVSRGSAASGGLAASGGSAPSFGAPTDSSAPAGAPPSARDEQDDAAGRRVFAGGRRMKRLREVEELEPAPAPSLVESSRSAFESFLSSTVVRLLEMAKGADAKELPPFLDRLAQTCHRERRVDEARVLHERALQIRARYLGADHADTGVNHHGLGKIYLEWGRYVEAEQYLLDAVKVFEKGLRKARFMLAAEAVEPAYVSTQLAHLVGALHSLASLYHEQKKFHLCSQLHDTAVSAINSVDASLRVNIDAQLESLAAMAVQAELHFAKPVDRIRATF